MKTKCTLCTRVKVGKQSNCQKTHVGLFSVYMEFFWFKTEAVESLAEANVLLDTALEILPFLTEPLQRAPGPTDVCLNLFQKEKWYFTLKMNASIYKANYPKKHTMYFCCYYALSDAAGINNLAACRHCMTETMQYNITFN